MTAAGLIESAAVVVDPLCMRVDESSVQTIVLQKLTWAENIAGNKEGMHFGGKRKENGLEALRNAVDLDRFVHLHPPQKQWGSVDGSNAW